MKIGYLTTAIAGLAKTNHYREQNQMNLQQELAEAPEPEPVARVTGYYAGYLSIATVDGRVLPAGTALYTAPPAPSVPDGMKLIPKVATPEMLAGLIGAGCCKSLEKAYAALYAAAPTPAEAPADVAQDAERLDWLEQEAKESRTGVSIVYKNQADDEGGIKRGYRLMRYHQIFSARLNLREAIDAAIAAEKGGAK